MDEPDRHYLRDYWKEAPGRARREVLRDFRKEIAWRILELCVLAAALLGPLLWDLVSKGRAVFSSSLWPDLWHGAAFAAGTLALGILVHLLVLTPARIRRDALLKVREAEDEIAGLKIELALRPKPEPPPPVTIAPMVSSDVLNRLREIYEPCRSATALAREYLLLFCLDWYGGPLDKWEQLVARLFLRESALLADSDRSMLKLTEGLAAKGDFEAARFADLMQTLDGMLSQYALLCEYILRAGSLFVGDETHLRSQPPYSQLYQRHLEAVGALRQVRARDDFGELAVQHIKQLKDLLPPPIVQPPPADPPSSTASA